GSALRSPNMVTDTTKATWSSDRTCSTASRPPTAACSSRLPIRSSPGRAIIQTAMDPPSPLPRGWTSTSCRPLPTEPNSPPLATAARTTADPGCTTSLSTTNTTSWSQNFAVALEPSQTHTNKHLATAIEALSCNKDHPMTSPSLETSPEFPQPWTPPAPPADRGQLDPEELYSRPEIEQLQFERLRWTLHHAYNNVPAYQELYD